MANAPLVSLGILADLNKPTQQVEKFYYNRFIKFLDSTPFQWRLWKAPMVTYYQLFGEAISEETSNELVFAMPMEDLAQVFGGAVAALTVADVRTVYALLLRWDIGRAMIVSPQWLSGCVLPTDRFDGRGINPLMWHPTLEAVVESSIGVHAVFCGRHVPVQRGPWAHGPLSPRNAQLVWENMTLEEAVSGTVGPFHVCRAFPDFDVDNYSD